ncbi:hypothetical protein [Rubripirellula reticaptiva]|uniref:hypothetical protein n=1 Tax=Rubripirellula reticaptiva TaxID=2528013 RepID=UPI0011B83724|nr:hypothetical protein [Rubripirellula reticaptiva]
MNSKPIPDSRTRHPFAAAFAWLIASCTLLLGIVYIVGIVATNYADPNFWHVAICMIPILLTASLLNAIAGLRWLRGISMPALAMQVAGCAILFGGSAIVTQFVIA